MPFDKRILKSSQVMKGFLSQYFSFVRKCLPSIPQKPSIGFDIGTRFCKVVEGVRTKNGFKVLNWAIEPVSSTDIAVIIRNLLEKIGAQSKSVYTAVSGQGTLIRFINMPRMSIEQLKESLSLEADKYFPFPINEIYMDCQIVENKRIKDNKMSVLVAVAKKSIIDARVALASGLSLQNNFVGLDALAVSNAITEFQEIRSSSSEGEGRSVFAILDMGETKTTIIIFRDSAPRFVREISIGGKDCTQRIMEVMGCSAEEAENIRRHPGAQQDEAFAACQGILQNLMSEIRLSLDYFSSEDALQAKISDGGLAPEDNSQVMKILLTGDNMNSSKLREFLAKELEVLIEPWAPSAGLEFQNETLKESFLKNINQLSVALGLALTKNDTY